MNAMPDHEVVVLDLAGHVAALVCRSPAIEPALRVLGFVAVSPRWERPITDDADRKQLADALIGLDGLFAEGAGWSPAELLRLYRERNTLTAAYRTISWLGPSAFRIHHHPNQATG
jgi:hypothetical protein